MTAELTNNVDRVFAVQHLRVTGDQHTHIVQFRHGPGQRRGNVTQTAGLHQVGDFRGHKQHFLSVGILTDHRRQRLGTRDVDRLGTWGAHGACFADLLMSTFSLDI
ncbi:hypothetical protein D3C84_821250 [compost metagenome]